MKQLTTRDVAAVLSTVYDPEIPVDLVSLGLIYGIDINRDNDVLVTMSLTFPGCPMAHDIEASVLDALLTLPDIGDTDIRITFEPLWEPEFITDATKAELGVFVPPHQ